MGSHCGVSWDDTKGGKLDRSEIPDPPDHKNHFLNAAETKGDSSFPVVDGNGNLRAGNVNSAWDLKGRGEGVSEECLRKLDGAFEDNVLPDSAYENSDTVPLAETDVDGNTFGMNVEFATIPREALAEGFNRHGVRENDDGSIDVRFKVMEPGERKGVEITEPFLRNVASHDYSTIPLQLDHSDSQRANVGYVEAENILFSNGALNAQVHVPSTGSDVREDVIADFTHDPPQITDISVGFDPRTLEVEKPRGSEDAPRFTDARIREFSLTPFPAGYDNGGLTPEFSAAVEQATICDCNEFDEPTSQLIQRPHILIEK